MNKADARSRQVGLRRRPSHLSKILSVLWVWSHRWTTRRTLDELDDRLLRDVGLSAEEKGKEAKKPFWRR